MLVHTWEELQVRLQARGPQEPGEELGRFVKGLGVLRCSGSALENSGLALGNSGLAASKLGLGKTGPAQEYS